MLIETPPRISKLSRKETGAHYTPRGLADFVAEKIVEICEATSEKPRILDPAVGDGSLLAALLRRLPNVRQADGFDTDAAAVSVATRKLHDRFPSTKINIVVEDFIALCSRTSENDLFSNSTIPLFDIVIANPPYVRTQVIGAAKSQALSDAFQLTGRVDLYFSFLIGISRVLRAGGIAGIIVSNRFMTTRAGAEVRKRLLEDFDILHIWDFGDTKLFEAAVLPVVLLLRRKTQNYAQKITTNFSSIYTTREVTNNEVKTVFEALRMEGDVKVSGQAFHVKHGILDHGLTETGVWRLTTKKMDDWLQNVRRHTFCTFGDLGKIRVGVKTTADKVFIRDDWDTFSKNTRPELLKPLMTHHNARRYRANKTARNAQILYTHEMREGKRTVIDIACFPKAAAYLNQHRAQLEARRYVIEAGRNWFEIWVPQNPDAWKLPKLVFPDISEQPNFWLDLDGTVVNGDCYWLALNDESKSELLWLALAVANSTFIEEYYDHVFHNKLYSGRRRFMTQYVEQFPLPDPNTEIALDIVKRVKELYQRMGTEDTQFLEIELDDLVRKAFSLFSKKFTR